MWRGWDGGGKRGSAVSGKGKAYFEILAERKGKKNKKQDEHVVIDVMEGDGIKREMKKGKVL